LNDPKNKVEAWAVAKRIVDQAKEPEWVELADVPALTIGQHGEGKHTHELQRTNKEYEVYPKITVVFSYAVCPKCKEARWKKFIAWNNYENLSYEREIIKQGELNG
jgi:hypothetical protein